MRIIEISHRSHLQHNLRLETQDEPFHCNGCKEPGIGSRYTCETCRFNLHESCAVAAPGATLEHHLFSNSTFNFHHEHPKRPEGRICDACGKRVQGFVYYCSRGDRDLHPCCASLRPEITEDGLTLRLRKEASRPCSRCGDVGKYWFYRSECKNVYLHVACMKEMACENWETNFLNGSNWQMQITHVPILQGVVQNFPRERAGSSVDSFCRKVGKMIRIIIAAILGDPTVLIATTIGAALS